MKTWNETKQQTLEALRAAYLAEVLRLAESLRPRFESGELHGYNAADEAACDAARAAFFQTYKGPEEDVWSEWRSHQASLPRPAIDVLGGLCARWFDLEVDEEDDLEEEASRTASLILAVSPGASLTDDAQALVGEAIMAVYYDVLAVARARGLYSITPGEDPKAEDTAWALEAA